MSVKNNEILEQIADINSMFSIERWRRRIQEAVSLYVRLLFPCIQWKCVITSEISKQKNIKQLGSERMLDNEAVRKVKWFPINIFSQSELLV